MLRGRRRRRPFPFLNHQAKPGFCLGNPSDPTESDQTCCLDLLPSALLMRLQNQNTNSMKTHPLITLGQTLVLALAILLSDSVIAADWPQWRGPSRDGISRETGLLKEWPTNGPALLWQQQQVGSGYSAPAVVGDLIFLTANKGMDDEFVQALAVKDGKQIWKTTIGKVGVNKGPQYPGARSTPTVDSERLYVLGSDGDLACLEAASGKIQWKRNLRSEFGGEPGNWAYCESVIVDGEALYCAPGGTNATVIALNKKSGDVIWKCAAPGGDSAGNASPILADIGGIRQYVQPMGKGILGVDTKTGKFLWRFDKTPGAIPTPVVFNDLIYCAGQRSGGGVLKLKVDNGSVEVETLYFQSKMPTAIGGVVRVGDHLYGSTQQGLMCAVLATGEAKWQERGVGSGSILFAEGLLYIHGNDGDVALVEATPEAYKERGRLTPPNQPKRAGQTKAWAYPVVANGRLYIRDLDSLWCYDIRAE